MLKITALVRLFSPGITDEGPLIYPVITAAIPTCIESFRPAEPGAQVMIDLHKKLDDIEHELKDLNNDKPTFMVELKRIRSLLFVVAAMMVSVAMSFIWHIMVQ